VYAAAAGWRLTSASTRRTTALGLGAGGAGELDRVADQGRDRVPVEAQPRVGGEPVEQVVVGAALAHLERHRDLSAP
jgi:hypothetical protein